MCTSSLSQKVMMLRSSSSWSHYPGTAAQEAALLEVGELCAFCCYHAFGCSGKNEHRRNRSHSTFGCRIAPRLLCLFLCTEHFDLVRGAPRHSVYSTKFQALDSTFEAAMPPNFLLEIHHVLRSDSPLLQRAGRRQSPRGGVLRVDPTVVASPTLAVPKLTPTMMTVRTLG